MKASFQLIEVFNEPAMGFRGNISAVVSLRKAMSADVMQEVARDFNQPATTFLWPGQHKGNFHVRWFAPDAEIGLCGHGSLAALAFLAKPQESGRELKLIYSKGSIFGQMQDSKSCSMLLDPIPVKAEQQVPPVVEKGLGVPVKAFFTTDNKQIVLLENEKSLREMKPDFATLRQSDIFGYAVTAPGDEADFVSRTLVPHVQQLEDHATGSSHAALTPFWSQRLDKKNLTAHQLSPRGGKFWCEFANDKVKLTGQFTVLAKGEVFLLSSK